MLLKIQSDESIFSQLQKEFEMKKIIILSGTGETRIDLVSHLKGLFPECEIQILKYRFDSIEQDIITEITGLQPE